METELERDDLGDECEEADPEPEADGEAWFASARESREGFLGRYDGREGESILLG